ncbi:MAG: anthranilate phosphoribosyltransferase [Actinobacteria bacterium]|nr:anthranilate phosphoribosyltransferase [Actinomycetota bacterium]MCI0677681.1 anthranilate phosphoribosyltransferase [Actinomycetota bacterium]
MRDLLATILSGATLGESEATRLLEHLTAEDLDPVMAAAALAGMRTRGETPVELRAFAAGLQSMAVAPEIPDVTGAVDVVGTGGDSSGSLNLSTGAALLAAAAGAPVIKHGNRSVSSRCGSFDVLAALGLDVPWDPMKAATIFDATGFTYLFAPAFHPAMRTIAPVRRAMGVRTIFNLAGPLANPARTPHLVVGAFSPSCAEMIAETLAGMSITRAFVVHGEPGWDEPTPVGPYLLYDVTPGRVVAGTEDPADLGFPRADPEALLGADPVVNAAAMTRVFAGEDGPHRDALVLGASLALRVLGEGVEESLTRVREALDSGEAAALVERLRSSRETASV